MALNLEQSKIVDCLDKSVNVVAGAGTGKTFTLTQRIVAAVSRTLEDDPDDSDPTSHVLAITFTRKAAGELKSRVRQAFLEKASSSDPMADRYLECALRIDSAWISTIHSMASRILRENAIDFGIDPSFKTLTAQGEAMIFSQALQLALDDVLESEDGDLIDFVTERDLESLSRTSHSVSDAVREVLGSTSYMPDGLAGVEILMGDAIAAEAIRPFMAQASVVRRLFDLDGWSKGDSKKIPQLARELDAAIASMSEWLDAHSAQGETDLDGFFDALYSFPMTTNKFGKSSEHFDEMLKYRFELRAVSEQMAMVRASEKARMLLRFASMVKARMDEIKRTGRTKFTESDLLVVCDQKLSESANLAVLERYREQFKYIMLDEFQDTDPLQMAIISKIARQPEDDEDGNPLSNVCTVGDMQQSIYRFRGGDVEETQKRIAAMEAGQGEQFALTGNYRSHADVLDAVKCVFSQPQAFGEEFLDLTAARIEPDSSPQPNPSGPRVSFLFIHGRRGSSRGETVVEGVSMADVRFACARQIAAHFKKLADAGARPSQMALLLGGMPSADVYASALRDMGFECVITGGSVFADAPEAKVVRALLRYAVNQRDDEALLHVLASATFQVSDDALLALVRVPEGDRVRSRKLSAALLSFDGIGALSEEDNKALDFAKRVLARFVSDARKGSPASALRRLFADSGHLLFLQGDPSSQAMSNAGNIAKAIRIVGDIERDSSGIAEVATKYAAHLESSKEAPGVLAASDSEYIQIMTVHASKGLEFEHVALAEIGDGTHAEQRVPLVMENIDGKTYLSYGVSKGEFEVEAHYDIYKKIKAFTFEDLGADAACNPLGDPSRRDGESKRDFVNRRKEDVKSALTYEHRHEILSSYHAMQELEEARRLMYVAMTRAKETLLVTYGTTTKVETGYKGTFDDIYQALLARFRFGDTGFKDTFMASDASMGARRIAFDSQDEFKAFIGDVEEDTDPGRREREMVSIPIYEDDEAVSILPYNHSRRNIRSYTSLSKVLPEDAMEPEDKLDGHASFDGEGAPYFDDEMVIIANALGAREGLREDATSLGTAFHRLCEIAIIEAAREGAHVLTKPAAKCVDAQSKLLGLSDSQRRRLEKALSRWFGSSLASELASHSRMAAEVPFSVWVGEGERDHAGCGFVLEGEIDALADDDDGRALLVDYKTGQLDGASIDSLGPKHLFQSQCYAYALLMGGYKSVRAVFVKVEEEQIPSSPDDIIRDGSLGEPMQVEYSYSLDDVSSLRDDLMAAYQYSIGLETA